MRSPRIGGKYPPGSRVRSTGQFLKWTGQQAGGEGEKVWTVVGCECGLCQGGLCQGRFVAVNEGSIDDPQHPRHIAVSNLCGEHELTTRNDP